MQNLIRQGEGGRSLLDAAAVLLKFGPLVILACLTVGLALASPVFLTVQNMKNVGSATAFIAVLAAGQFLVILVRGLDISVGSNLAFAVAAAAFLFSADSATQLVLGSLFFGALVGFVNGLLVVKGKIAQPIIVTVATLGVVRGLALLVSNGVVMVGVPDAIRTLGGGFIGPVPVPVLIAVGLGLILAFALRSTLWGRYMYAIGGDPEAAKRLGINTSKILMSAYVICGVAAGVAGILVAGRTTVVDPSAGRLAELDAITAVVIGGASLHGGRGTVLNVMVGALILGVLRNGLNLLGVSSFYQMIFIGVLVLVAMEIDVVRSRLDERLKVRRTMEAESL